MKGISIFGRNETDEVEPHSTDCRTRQNNCDFERGKRIATERIYLNTLSRAAFHFEDY